MKKARILLFKDCNRNCLGCCNKEYDLDNLPVFDFTKVSEFDEIILTGGEPGLDPILVRKVLMAVGFSELRKTYLYTAMPDKWILDLMEENLLNGVTITLHDHQDIIPFMIFQDLLKKRYYQRRINVGDYSWRLNVFKKVTSIPPNKHTFYVSKIWKVKYNMEWIKDCPLPENETFYRLEHG